MACLEVEEVTDHGNYSPILKESFLLTQLRTDSLTTKSDNPSSNSAHRNFKTFIKPNFTTEDLIESNIWLRCIFYHKWLKLLESMPALLA